MMIINLPKDKKHIEKNEQETQEIIKKINHKDKQVTLLGEIRKTLNEIAKIDGNFQYCEMPTIANNKTFYILWDNEVFGEFYVRFRIEGDSVNFIHGNAEFSYHWDMLKNDSQKLKELLTAYVAGFDEFEEVVC